MDLNKDSRFAVYAEVDGQAKALVVTDLTFERLIDEIVVPYHGDEAFFVDGVPVKRQQVRRLKVVHQGPSFAHEKALLYQFLSHGPVERQKVVGQQYDARLEAIVREHGDDVTSQVLKAYERKIKPGLKDYLPRREELIKGAMEIFVESMKKLGAG
ncbi:MAG: hypothetical protein Q7R30_05315 [Acidobacteriota bacterium]|nr:hypothetical protein [Acidobacteriota bacterium]